MIDAQYIPPKFTKEMKSTHKILIPNMAPLHFSMLQSILLDEGYQVEVLQDDGPNIAQEGLKYVHNDTCYPALLVIGQFITALKSGRYDLDHTALLITQTGGGCRASNYIHLLRKALYKAGLEQIPVASLNFSGLEKDSGFSLTLPMARKLLAAVLYGDMLMCLKNQVAPYELHSGDAQQLTEKWVAELCNQFSRQKGVSRSNLKQNFAAIAHEFAQIPRNQTPKIKVGIVGEIYVKYSPLGNNHLEEFLASEGCEVNLPGLMGFVQYCISNMSESVRMYGGSAFSSWLADFALQYLDGTEQLIVESIRKEGLRPPTPFLEMKKLATGLISYGNVMGEGWLLTAEMAELIVSGFENIVCAQPFGCLPNHISGKGMVNKLRAMYPNANITPIDYDPSATKVNQENRIKLMLAVAKERLQQASPTVDHSFTEPPHAHITV